MNFNEISNKLLIFTLFTVLTNCEKCNELSDRKLDSIVAKIATIGNSGRKFPENKVMLDKYCEMNSIKLCFIDSESRSYVLQVEKYKNKCLKDLAKQATSVMVYSFKSSINNFCKNDSKRVLDLLEANPCMNRGAHYISKCYTRYIDNLLGAKFDQDHKKIPHICCSYFRSLNCTENYLLKVPRCSQKSINSGLEFIRSLFGNIINMMCGDYTEGSDLCDKLGLPPHKKSNQRRPQSFIIPMFELFSSFKDN